MDKALVFGAKDCRFESCQGQRRGAGLLQLDIDVQHLLTQLAELGRMHAYWKRTCEALASGPEDHGRVGRLAIRTLAGNAPPGAATAPFAPCADTTTHRWPAMDVSPAGGGCFTHPSLACMHAAQVYQLCEQALHIML